MRDEEIQQLEKEAGRPFKCPHTDCPDYMLDTYCHTHIHVRCPQYEHESAVRDFLKNYRENQTP
jgi:hypothetical protein